MFKKPLLMLMLLCVTQGVFADELASDCEAAVDAADRLNPESNKHCDYSKTGLNGVLHKAFANREKPSEATAPKMPAETSKAPSVPLVLAGEFDSAQQLSSVRYELLQRALRQCGSGFAVVDERYLPITESRLKLELNYHCL